MIPLDVHPNPERQCEGEQRHLADGELGARASAEHPRSQPRGTEHSLQSRQIQGLGFSVTSPPPPPQPQSSFQPTKALSIFPFAWMREGVTLVYWGVEEHRE